jgi:conjugal transfer pilus assembly protein TraV
MLRKFSITGAFMSVALLSGCANLSGYQNSSSTFACSAPDGVACSSISGVYANAKQGTLPGQTGASTVSVSGTSSSSSNQGDELWYMQSESVSSSAVNHQPVQRSAGWITGDALETTKPIYKTPFVLRVWLAPWQDSDNVLHDQSLSYVVINEGQWNIEHVKHKLIEQGTLSLQRK